MLYDYQSHKWIEKLKDRIKNIDKKDILTIRILINIMQDESIKLLF